MGLCCRRLQVPPGIMAENALMQKTMEPVLMSLRKGRSQEVIGERLSKSDTIVLQRKVGHSTPLEVAWRGRRFIHS